mmetsp:Transcript_17585/g.61469  ORF Transcript_17585/g.61469 Transcript_17585/m.61469 type:complete len:202 (-) Transcript_17585:359-964(-)
MDLRGCTKRRGRRTQVPKAPGEFLAMPGGLQGLCPSRRGVDMNGPLLQRADVRPALRERRPQRVGLEARADLAQQVLRLLRGAPREVRSRAQREPHLGERREGPGLAQSLAAGRLKEFGGLARGGQALLVPGQAEIGQTSNQQRLRLRGGITRGTAPRSQLGDILERGLASPGAERGGRVAKGLGGAGSRAEVLELEEELH